MLIKLSMLYAKNMSASYTHWVIQRNTLERGASNDFSYITNISKISGTDIKYAE